MAAHRLRLVAIDLASVAVAFAVAFLLRFEAEALTVEYLVRYLPVLPLFVAVKLWLCYRAGLYRRVWRYASTAEAMSIGKAVSASSLVIGAAVLALGWWPLELAPFKGFPRSILAIDWLLMLLLVGLSRFALRLLSESRVQRRRLLAGEGGAPRNILVAGAGDAGAMIVRDLKARPGGVRVVGFVDDDPAKQGLEVNGVPVLGRSERLPELLAQIAVHEVIIAMPTAAGRTIRRISELCREADVPCRTVPSLHELIGGRVSLGQTREVRIEDLLRREPVDCDETLARATFAGRVVLVTGGGGSIGSELCRQVAAYGPARLVLFGHGENSVFESVAELRRRFPEVPVTPVIGSVADRARVRALFRDHEPEIVFHAAAHKHVGLMEANPAEAVRNNVLGTRAVAEEAVRAGVQRFVLVSTDKAVQPSNVMGATKHLAELLVRDLAGTSGTVFAAVRFGNVLGSRGSLVPILRRQIANGGPVTVTDPEATRYFMTIPEAARLVVQAGALARGGEVFVLQMGEPVRILDLAHDLITLSGLRPGDDVQIVFTGLKPGEKLHEALVEQGDALADTAVPGVQVARPAPVESRRLTSWLQRVEPLLEAGDDAAVHRALLEYMPGAELAATRSRPAEHAPLPAPPRGLPDRQPTAGTAFD